MLWSRCPGNHALPAALATVLLVFAWLLIAAAAKCQYVFAVGG